MGEASGTTAVIMAGAAAKGPFEAGALQVLAENGVPVGSVMGTSAGALNAVLFAAGIRGGREKDAADALVSLWRDHATLLEGFTPSPLAMLELRGAAHIGSKVVELMDAQLRDLVSGPARNPVHLSMVVCPLLGTKDEGSDATTFERVVRFRDADFEDATLRERMRNTAIASAAIPGVYAPVELDFDDIGLCVDGGVVNNTPMAHAMETDEGDVSRIIVIVPHPVDYEVPDPGHFLTYANHLVNILIQERLYRDLKQAMTINRQLADLQRLVGQAGFTEEQYELVRRTLGWRPLEIVQIRPPKSLEGDFLQGFSSARLRAEYIRLGREAAEAQLGVLRKAAPVPAPVEAKPVGVVR